MKEEKKAEKDILSSFLTVLLQNKTKKEALQASLYEIVSIDWLPIAPKGGIFLVSENHKNQLNLYTTTANFSPQLLTLCKKIDFGYCICGKAASSKEIVFVNCIDDSHDIRFDEMTPHGHYSVPFFNSHHLLQGVLVLYVDHGHISRPEEIAFLKLVAYGLGAVCERFDFEEKYDRQKEYLLRQRRSLDVAALVSETDKDGVITYANSKFCEISKYTLKELVGSPHRIVNSGVHPKEFWKDCWDTLKEGKVWKGEVCNKAKDGSFYWVEATLLPIYNNNNGNNEIVGYSAIRLDITSKKETEKKQREHNSKLAFLGKIATEIGHEINTPLGIIQMNAGLIRILLKKMETPNEKIIQMIDTIEETIVRVSKIVSGLKIIGRSSDNNIIKINAHKALLSIIELIVGIYKMDDIVVEFKSKEDNVCFNGDHGKFHQVVTNLLSNAKDALLESGKYEKKIKIMLTNENNKIVISISDNANGVSPNNLKNIFKENFTTKEIGKGTGIGLSISKSFIEEMLGSISVESKLKNGTTFKICLPVSHQKEKSTVKDLKNEKTRPYQTLSGNVLIAEDNTEMRELLATTIEGFGLTVTGARDGQEALELLQEKTFDILVTDLRMPRLTGEELLEKIKKMNLYGLKIITLSGEISPFVLKENQSIIKEMADKFLEKPITRRAIYEALFNLGVL